MHMHIRLDPCAGESALATAQLQEAIDTVSAGGGGTVSIPAGVYHTGTVELRSHVHIHLEPGAVIRGSGNIADYTEQSEGHIYPEFPTVRCLFVGFDLEDVVISGPGTVDGAGSSFIDYDTPTFDEFFTPEALQSLPPDRRHEYVAVKAEHRPTWIFYFARCNRLRFRDLHIRDAARWTFHVSRSRHVYFEGLCIENDLRAANSDGIHLTACHRTLITNCSITSGDDCIAVTTYCDRNTTSSNTVISNCILTSHSAAVRIGFGEEGILEDVSVSDCTIRRANRAIGVFADRGSVTRGVRVSNTRIETRLIAGSWWGKAEPVFVTPLGDGATIEDLDFRGLRITAEQGIIMSTHDASAIRDVRFCDIDLRLVSGPMTAFSSGVLDARPREIRRRTLPPVLLEGVSDIEINRMRTRVDRGAAAYFTRNLELTDCRNVRIDDYTEDAD